jgi:nitronate monooxygenase
LAIVLKENVFCDNLIVKNKVSKSMILLKTPFTEQVGIEYPIICGAMYPCSSPELVAAVSETGAIGIVQPMSFTHTRHLDLREALRKIRSITSKPYGFNIILVPGYEDRLKAWTDIALEEGCRFFITALGKPTWVLEKVHGLGGVVYHDVIKREYALKAIDAGVDGLICVNNRAGGHAGYRSEVQLYEELKDLGKPMICAGGIGDETDFVHALKMGFAGVQMATRFIASFECDESDEYKQAIIDAQEADIVMTNKVDGVPGTVIKTPFVAKQGLNVGPFMEWLLRNRYTKKLTRGWLMSRASGKINGSGTDRWFSAGKSVGRIHKVEHVKDIVSRFVKAAQ